MLPESSLGELANLTCPAGHRWYSPTPAAWVGSECRAGLTEDHRRRACAELLVERDPFRRP